MTQWEEITEVALPLPFDLKIIKAYLIKGSRGYTIIDTGLHSEDNLETWQKFQQEGGWTWQDVEKIVLTHYHPDHYGFAGKLQQLTGAPVYMSQTDYDQAQLFWARDSDMPEVMANYYRKHGLNEELAEKIPSHLRNFIRWVEPHPEPTFIQGGDRILLGDREYIAYHTPGHADGHLSFFDPERGWLIGGDFLLPRISPNISLWPKCDPDPLRVYLETLARMKEVAVTRVFPSHGLAFDFYQERIEQLEQHHANRLQEVKRIVREQGKATAFETCQQLFSGTLSVHNLRFALSETLAHLEYLRIRGEMSLVEQGAYLYYQEV